MDYYILMNNINISLSEGIAFPLQVVSAGTTLPSREQGFWLAPRVILRRQLTLKQCQIKQNGHLIFILSMQDNSAQHLGRSCWILWKNDDDDDDDDNDIHNNMTRTDTKHRRVALITMGN